VVQDVEQERISPHGERDARLLADLADRFERELDRFAVACATCLRGELDGWFPCAAGDRDSEDLLGQATRAIARDSLARLRTGAGARTELPADVIAAARAAAVAGGNVCALLDRYGEMLWDAISRATEEVVREPALRWRLLMLARAHLSGYVPRLSEELRSIYEQECQRLAADDDGFRANRLALVLSGQLNDLGVFDYDLQQHHAAIVTDSKAVVARLALMSGRQRLHVVRPGLLVHGWLGGREPFDAQSLDLLAAERHRGEARIALGEPGFGVEGFRSSHRQALEAWRIVRCGACRVARYTDVVLPIALARDQTVARTFLARYLERLDLPLREAAQAYLRSGHNASAAAAHLRRSRRTVERQLARVEDCLRRPITEVAGELSVGFQLAELATYEGWWEGPLADPWDPHRRATITP
jgi:hypothetical protein